MSRITGIIYRRDTRYRTSLLTKMLAALQSEINWQTSCESLANASFGWRGWRAPNISNVHGMITVMDGCIYNRAELGHSVTDAELLSALYVRYGFEGAVQQINGDFAVALYDPRMDTLWLGGDRFGIKPLYYVSNSQFFAFASRPRALLTLPGITREVNRQFVALFAASHYRYFDNNPESSPYIDIAQLPAAHMLRLRDGHVNKMAYWSLQDVPDFTDSEAELGERYRELLIDAISLRLESAHRPVFTLSGGMDSSSVLASAVYAAGAKQHAFSAVYTDKTYDESAEIQSMLDATVEQWHPVTVGTPDVFELVQRMIEVHDEPVATATWLSHFLLCEETARQGFGSLFGGLGGDELNAGEYEHFLFYFADLRAAGNEERLAREVEMWIHYYDHPIYLKSFDVVKQSLTRLVDFTEPGRCLPDRDRLTRYASALNRDYFDLQAFEPIMEHPFRSYIKNRTYQDLTRETIPPCLRAEDRQATAFGLQNFLPFFDHRLVEFMFRVPGRLKYRDGVTKHLLREAMCGVLPEETRTRVKKTGWNAPAHVWFSGAGLESLLDLVHSQSFCERGIYNVEEVCRLIEEHDHIVSTARPVENHMMFLWQLVNLELWLQWNQAG